MSHEKAILSAIENEKQRPILVAVDGRCAAGKTTVARQIQALCGCNLIHMDHFFLPIERRTAERLAEPGGTIDRERFSDEVLRPLRLGRAFSYRPFDCRRQAPAETIVIEPKPVTIIEGAYCCHPSFFSCYDLTVFMSVSPDEQIRRIRQRNGAAEAVRFQEEWIPREEQYFADCDIPNRCGLFISTDGADRAATGESPP